MKEEMILRKLRRREPSGLEELMDQYIPYVSTVVWNILRNAMAKEDAEEVVSDVFLAAWNRAADIRPGYAKAWLGAGTFSFDVGIVNEAKKVELDVAGLIYGGDTSRTWTCGFEECGKFCEGLETNGREHTEYWNYSVAVKKLVISPLSAEWEIDYSTDKWNLSLGLQFAVVMKDGSRVEMTATAMSDGGTYSRGIYRFETPVDLDEVDYILIGDEKIDSTHMVYLPTNE